MDAICRSGKRYLLSFCSLPGLRSGIIILFRSIDNDDVIFVKSTLLLFNRNSIPPFALPLGNVIDFACASLVIVSVDFGVIRGVIVVSVRTVGMGEKTGEKREDASSFDKEESRRSFVRLTGVEKLVLMVKGWEDTEEDLPLVSFVL